MNTRFFHIVLIGLLCFAFSANAQDKKPEFVLQNGHSYSVSAVAFSPDGKTLASGSDDYTVKLWDAKTGKLIDTLTGHSRAVSAVAFSLDGKTLVSGSDDATVKLWDAKTGKLIDTLTGHSSNVTAVAFSPDGKTLASGSWDTTVKLWDAKTGKLIDTLTGHSRAVTAVAFSPDGKTLASGSWDTTVKLWDAKTGKLIDTLTGHYSHVNAVAFSPDGKTLASGSGDTSIRLWKMSDRKILAIFYGFNSGEYLTYTAEGYYVSSKEGEKFASWRIDNNIYTFEQYSERFNRPNIVSKVLALEHVPLPAIQISSDLPPTLTLLSHLDSISTDTVDIVFEFEGTDELKEVIVFHNNRFVEIEPTSHGKKAEINISLKLTDFENIINVIAYDKKLLKSECVSASFFYAAGAKGHVPGTLQKDEERGKLGEYGKKYAIVIGISDYKNLPKTPKHESELTDLKYTHNDAKAFIQFLETPDLSGRDWEIHDFINDNATAPEIDNTLTRILTTANRRDLVFIFFSGHGRSHPLRQKDVYLLTYDFEKENHRSGISYSTLRDMIADSKAEKIIAFIDACRSGIIGFKGSDDIQATFSQDAFGERLAQIPENKVIFTSGRGTQPSWEDDDEELSVFTYYLVKGLKGEAAEHMNPKFVDLGELAEYVKNKVITHTQNHPKMQPQMPCLREKDGMVSEDFPVAIRKLK